MSWDTVITSSTFTQFITDMAGLVGILIPGIILPLAFMRKGLDLVKGLVYRA